MRKLPSFDALWASYPTANSPCEGGYQNQCAIRLSIALINAGFALDGYIEPVCRHGHARGAESLGRYLSRVVAQPVRGGGTGMARFVAGRRCVLMFKNIAGFRGGRGDHIDLWSGTKTKSGAYFEHCQHVWAWELT